MSCDLVTLMQNAAAQQVLMLEVHFGAIRRTYHELQDSDVNIKKSNHCLCTESDITHECRIQSTICMHLPSLNIIGSNALYWLFEQTILEASTRSLVYSTMLHVLYVTHQSHCVPLCA